METLPKCSKAGFFAHVLSLSSSVLPMCLNNLSGLQPTLEQVYRRAGATRSSVCPSSPSTSSPAPHPHFLGNQDHFVPTDGNAIGCPALYRTAADAYPSTSGGSTLRNPEAEGIVPRKNPNSAQGVQGGSLHADVVGFGSKETRSFALVLGFDGTSKRVAGGRDTTDDNANKVFSPTRKLIAIQMNEDAAQKVSPSTSNVRLTVASATMVRPQGIKQENCIQYEDELRKERRRVANREAARRSRLRKQEECNKLQEAALALKSETSFLRKELMRLSEECMELEDENKLITEEIVHTYGQRSISDLEAKYPPEIFHRYLDDKNSNDSEIQSTRENSQ